MANKYQSGDRIRFTQQLTFPINLYRGISIKKGAEFSVIESDDIEGLYKIQRINDEAIFQVPYWIEDITFKEEKESIESEFDSLQGRMEEKARAFKDTKFDPFYQFIIGNLNWDEAIDKVARNLVR